MPFNPVAFWAECLQIPAQEPGIWYMDNFGNIVFRQNPERSTYFSGHTLIFRDSTPPEQFYYRSMDYYADTGMIGMPTYAGVRSYDQIKAGSRDLPADVSPDKLSFKFTDDGTFRFRKFVGQTLYNVSETATIIPLTIVFSGISADLPDPNAETLKTVYIVENAQADEVLQQRRRYTFMPSLFPDRNAPSARSAQALRRQIPQPKAAKPKDSDTRPSDK